MKYQVFPNELSDASLSHGSAVGETLACWSWFPNVEIPFSSYRELLDSMAHFL